jgi:hypothetical protein
MKKVFKAVILVTVLLSCISVVTAKCFDKMQLKSVNAGLEKVEIGEQQILMDATKGGFKAYDGVSKKELEISDGQLKTEAGKSSFSGKLDGMVINAQFNNKDDYIEVTGQIENPAKNDRAVILEYWVSPASNDMVFSYELNKKEKIAGDEEFESNAFPIAAMSSENFGVAMAIPPSEPRIFGMVGSDKGLCIRLYLGVSADTANFPNKAPFSFIIYPVHAKWGFRSAISKYYGFYPEYYKPRMEKYGYWEFQMGDRVPSNADEYSFSLVETQLDSMKGAVERDEKYGVKTFPYMIVGQREIKFLDKLPEDYNEAMAEYDKWTVEDHAGHEVTKENEAAAADIHLKEEVATSGIQGIDGKYAIVIRKTPWGDNSVTYRMNPNPDLFRDQGKENVATYAFDLMKKWFKQYPQMDGIFTDSLGRMWPAVLNYRRDHFKYTRFPLTFNPDGVLAIHNTVSHYEYLDYIRNWTRSEDKLSFANGVYAYKANGFPAEHPKGRVKIGRFFLSAVLDIGTCEAGIHANIQRCQDVRAMFGRKPYAYMNYYWEDEAKVQEYVNKSLCFGIFSTISTNFFTGVIYETHPDGYLRDKKLLDWFYPLAVKLNKAGWEPVTYATVDNKDVSCERFGSGNTIYYTLYNDSEDKQTCSLTVDLKSIKFTEGGAVFDEIARNGKMEQEKTNTIKIELEPKKTYIIQVTKLWMWG